MPDFEPQQIGKMILITGIVISVIGVIVILLSKAGLFPLPGDIKLEGKNWKIYFPIVTCIVISIVLTGIMRIINNLRK